MDQPSMHHTALVLMNKLESDRLRLQGTLQTYIADPVIPLQDRWAMFLKMPDYLKASHKQFMWKPLYSILGEDAIGPTGDTMHVERYEAVYAIDLHDCFSENHVGEPGVYEKSCELKEAILKDNLYSFTYDW